MCSVTLFKGKYIVIPHGNIFRYRWRSLALRRRMALGISP